MINRVKIEILGASYTIATPESEEYVRSLAAELNSQMKSLIDADPKLTPNSALVLCAMGYADMFHKSEQAADNMRGQLTDYLDEASRARAELDEAKRELEKLRRGNNNNNHNRR